MFDGRIQYINASGTGSKAYDLTSNTTLYAKWTSGNITLPNATKTGYTFNGWYTASSGGTKVGDSGSSYSPTSNVTLYAQYTEVIKEHKLTINPNGGKWNNTTSNSTFTATEGTTKTINDPVAPSGYTVTFDSNGGSSVSPIISTKSFGSWTKSGSGTLSGTTFTYGTADTILTANYTNNKIVFPSTTKSGYIFNGWYSSAGIYMGTSGSTYTATSDTTLYAHWTSENYRLNFDANGCGSLGISYVNVTIGKTYGDADDGDGLPSIAVKTGYTFNGWYTESNGGSKITNSTTVTQYSDSGTLYARCSTGSYNINYNLNNGTHGSSHPQSASFDSIINISNPTKKVTVNVSNGTTASGATLSSTSVSANQTFNGWDATNLLTSTAKYGTSSSAVNSLWTNSSYLVKATYFKSLANNGSTVTLNANWGQRSITLPTITKSGYTCGFATSSSATTITYASGATYTPNANGSTSVNLYGVCKAIAAPSLKVTFTTSANYSDTCSDTYTTNNGSCTFNDGYYTPLTLKIEATDENTVDKITFEYNEAGQTSYTDVKYTENVSFTKSGNTYSGVRTISSTGKRKFRVTATNNVGKTSTVIMNINAIEKPFAVEYGCSNKTLTASGNIYVWKGGSSCTNASQSGCDQMESNTLGIISKGAELCYIETVSSSSSVKFITAWIEASQFKYKGGVLTSGYNGYGTATSKVYNGKTYYYSKLTGWCNNSSCGYGWVISPAVD